MPEFADPRNERRGWIPVYFPPMKKQGFWYSLKLLIFGEERLRKKPSFGKYEMP